MENGTDEVLLATISRHHISHLLEQIDTEREGPKLGEVTPESASCNSGVRTQLPCISVILPQRLVELELLFFSCICPRP